MHMVFPIESHEADAPFTRAEMEATTGYHYSWQRGIEPVDITVSAGRDPAVISVALALIILILCTFNHIGKMTGEMVRNLIDVRERENVFDEASATDTRTHIFLLLQLFVSESLLLYSYFSVPGQYSDYPELNITLGLLLAVTAAYYVFQLAAYSLIGFVFAGIEATGLWLKGFNASLGLLSMALLIPSMASVFYPEYTLVMVTIAAICFIISKICFIIKGIRIFYHNFFSWLYFILYLCAVEIIPLILVYAEAGILCGLK